MLGELSAPITVRRSALDNRRFRTVLLVGAGVPVVLAYLWQGLVKLLLSGYLGDFEESYMRAASRIAHGLDPYDLCATMGCSEPTGPQYVMPPILAWLLQPFVTAPAHAVEIGVVLVLNASLAVFLWFTFKALPVRDWQLGALLVLVALAFEPTAANVQEGQVNLVLLALSGIWLYAWVGGRWWGGVALGAAIAVKLIQGPVALLMAWGRRWGMLAAGAATGLVLWLVAAPQYLFEYLLKVLPAVSAGTGLFENHSPGGTITRLFEPASFLGGAYGSPAPARAVTALVGLAVLAVTAVVLRRPATARNGRLLEAAAIVAATPLVATYSWGTHLVLLLLPMFVLIAWGTWRHDVTVLALVAAAWLLIGPGHKSMQLLLVSGYSNLVVLRLLAELGVLGVASLWLAALLAVHRERSAHRLDPADEQRAEKQEHDGARKDHAIA